MLSSVSRCRQTSSQHLEGIQRPTLAAMHSPLGMSANIMRSTWPLLQVHLPYQGNTLKLIYHATLTSPCCRQTRDVSKLQASTWGGNQCPNLAAMHSPLGMSANFMRGTWPLLQVHFPCRGNTEKLFYHATLTSPCCRQTRDVSKLQASTWGYPVTELGCYAFPSGDVG